MPDRLTGTISRILVDKGFGFIRLPDGREYFFNRSATPVFLTLQPDDLVSFEATMGPKGPRAEDVRLELRGVDRPL
jgi:cold shock CspA family protein